MMMIMMMKVGERKEVKYQWNGVGVWCVVVVAVVGGRTTMTEGKRIVHCGVSANGMVMYRGGLTMGKGRREIIECYYHYYDD